MEPLQGKEKKIMEPHTQGGVPRGAGLTLG